MLKNSLKLIQSFLNSSEELSCEISIQNKNFEAQHIANLSFRNGDLKKKENNIPFEVLIDRELKLH